MLFLKKIIISVLSSVILSFLLTFWFWLSIAEEQGNVGYFPLGLFFYFIFLLPVYLIGGAPYSYCVDMLLNKRTFPNPFLKYIIEFLLYARGGLLIMGILLVIRLLFFGGIADLAIFNTIIIGILAALIYFHIALVSNRVLNIFSIIIRRT